MSNLADESCIITKINETDYLEYFNLATELDKESDFRAYKPGERTNSYELFKNDLIQNLKNSILLICRIDGKIVGYIEGVIGSFNRNKHSIHFNIGILKAFTGRHLGELLISSLEAETIKIGIERIDLSVFTYNHNAIKLYKRIGYLIEGTKFNSFKVGEKKVDEFIMSKIL